MRAREHSHSGRHDYCKPAHPLLCPQVPLLFPEAMSLASEALDRMLSPDYPFAVVGSVHTHERTHMDSRDNAVHTHLTPQWWQSTNTNHLFLCPQVPLLFPEAMSLASEALDLMLSPDYPFAVIGSVHTRNWTRQNRAIASDEKLQMSVKVNSDRSCCQETFSFLVLSRPPPVLPSSNHSRTQTRSRSLRA